MVLLLGPPQVRQSKLGLADTAVEQQLAFQVKVLSKAMINRMVQLKQKHGEQRPSKTR